MNMHGFAGGLKLIARGFELIADSLTDAEGLSEEERELRMAQEWGTRGLNASDAKDLCRKHGFVGQKVGAWVRGGLVEMRDGDLRFLTIKALEAVAAGRSPAAVMRAGGSPS